MDSILDCHTLEYHHSYCREHPSLRQLSSPALRPHFFIPGPPLPSNQRSPITTPETLHFFVSPFVIKEVAAANFPQERWVGFEGIFGWGRGGISISIL